MKITSHDVLVDGIEDLEPVFSCSDEVQLLQYGEVMGCQVLSKIEMSPDIANAQFSFLEKTENAQAVLVADRSQESCSIN